MIPPVFISVILFGKKNHPEAVGTSYYIKGEDTFIVESPKARHYRSHRKYENLKKEEQKAFEEEFEKKYRQGFKIKEQRLGGYAILIRC